jgi:hypothetical protein
MLRRVFARQGRQMRQFRAEGRTRLEIGRQETALAREQVPTQPGLEVDDRALAHLNGLPYFLGAARVQFALTQPADARHEHQEYHGGDREHAGKRAEDRRA